jgi:hypothetical protein
MASHTPIWLGHSFMNGACASNFMNLSYGRCVRHSISVPLFQVGSPGYFTHISITVPVVSALKTIILHLGFSRSPNKI